MILKPYAQELIKVETPLRDEISVLAIAKVLDKTTHSTMKIKLKFIWNLATFNVTNIGLDANIFDPKNLLGIVDLRSLDYYKIEQGILQQILRKYYRFEKSITLYKQFNKFINMLKKERQQEESKENYLWLYPRGERKYMTDREILEKYINLEKSSFMRWNGHAV